QIRLPASRQASQGFGFAVQFHRGSPLGFRCQRNVPPCVAKAMILNLDRSLDLTLRSLASLPRNSALEGSASSANEIDFSSSAVSGRRGSIARLALVLSSSCGLDRRFNGTPRETTVASATSTAVDNVSDACSWLNTGSPNAMSGSRVAL